MVSLSRFVHVSLAFRSAGIAYGGNWQIELPADAPFAEIKDWLDHRCLYTDLAEFRGQDCPPELVGQLISSKYPDLAFVTIHASEDYSCTILPQKFRQSFRAANLRLELETNETRLMTSREQVTQSVMTLLPAYRETAFLNEKDWAENLFTDLQRALPRMVRLSVDLSGGQYIVVG